MVSEVLGVTATSYFIGFWGVDGKTIIARNSGLDVWSWSEKHSLSRAESRE